MGKESPVAGPGIFFQLDTLALYSKDKIKLGLLNSLTLVVELSDSGFTVKSKSFVYKVEELLPSGNLVKLEL